MATSNNLYRPADSDSSPTGNPISEAVAKAMAQSPDENLKLFWNSRQPLYPGYDPVPVYFHSVNGSTATFSLVDAKTGAAITAEKYEVDLKDLSKCYSSLPSTPRPDSSAIKQIVILMLAPGYHQVAKSASGKEFKVQAHEANIALTMTGKWPGTEAAELVVRAKHAEELLNSIIERLASPTGLDANGLRSLLRTKRAESASFTVPTAAVRLGLLADTI